MWLMAAAAAALVPLGDPSAWITAGDLPIEATRSQPVGAVTVDLTVNPTGLPDHCTVVEKAKDDSLAAAACATLMQRARFAPFNDAAMMTYRRQVAWNFAPLTLPRQSGAVVADHLLGSDGAVTACAEHVLGDLSLGAAGLCGAGKGIFTLKQLTGENPRRYIAFSLRTYLLPQGESAKSLFGPAREGQPITVLAEAAFTIGADGRVSQCTPVPHAGPVPSASLCAKLAAMTFAPPTDGKAQEPLHIYMDVVATPR